MNIQEALDMTDRMKPNMMPREMKIKYLQELDQLIFNEIVLKHEHNADAQLPEYNADMDPGTQLIVPEAYAMVYVYWLMSKIDLQNLELDKYNNDRTLFENAYDTMHDWWNRTYMPIQRHRQIYI